MSHDKKSIDALLATAASRMLNAGALIDGIRKLHAANLDEEYWRTLLVIADDLTIGGHALTEANKLLLANAGINTQTARGWTN